MKVIITGASGFLGKQIVEFYSDQEIITLGRKNAAITCNLSTPIPELPIVDLVIHAAGKAHIVPKTEEEKQEFFDVNVTGTQNLLKGLEDAPTLPKAFVFISSVAVYGLDKGVNINEDYPLNAKDSYGLSKIQAEEIIQEWCIKNNIICTILRLPLLIGEHPPGNLGAMIKGIKKGYYMNIAGGLAKKSMVMADDVASIILKVAQIGGTYNLTDGNHPNFMQLSGYIAQQLKVKPPKNIPNFLAKILAKFGDLMGKKAPFNSYKLAKIKEELTFDDHKARESFGWHPKPVIGTFKCTL